LATSTEGGTSSHHVGMVPLAISTADGTWPPAQWVVLRPLRSGGTSSQATGMVHAMRSDGTLVLKAGYPLRGLAVVAVVSTPVSRGWLSTE